jgi:hypothetical protein
MNMRSFHLLFFILLGCSYDGKNDLETTSLNYNTSKLLAFNIALDSSSLENISSNQSFAWNKNSWYRKATAISANGYLKDTVLKAKADIKLDIKRFFQELKSVYAQLELNSSMQAKLKNWGQDYQVLTNQNKKIYFTADFSLSIQVDQYRKQSLNLQNDSFIYEQTSKNQFIRLFWNKRNKMLNFYLAQLQGQELSVLGFEFLPESRIRLIQFGNNLDEKLCWDTNTKNYLTPSSCLDAPLEDLIQFQSTAAEKIQSLVRPMPLNNHFIDLSSEFPQLLKW